MSLDEAQLYNLCNGDGSGIRAATGAKRFAIEIMVIHLRKEHGMKMVDIHRRLKVPMKEIKNILDISSD